MDLSDYPIESLTFTGIGEEGHTAALAAEALARSLNRWARDQRGRRLLQITTVPTTAGQGVGLAAILIHTAGAELSDELAEEVAAGPGGHRSGRVRRAGPLSPAPSPLSSAVFAGAGGVPAPCVRADRGR
jgi:hypothetical protein